MAALSNYLERALLNHTLGKVVYTPPTDHYVSLHVANPGEDALATTEVSGGEYQRAACRFTLVDPETSQVQSVDTVAYVEMPALTVTHAGVWDRQIGGNLLFYGPLKEPVAVTAFGVFVIKAGELKIGLE